MRVWKGVLRAQCERVHERMCEKVRERVFERVR